MCEYTWNYDTAHTASPFQLREIQHVVIQGQATTPSEFIKQRVINPAREPDRSDLRAVTQRVKITRPPHAIINLNDEFTNQNSRRLA